MADRSRYGTAPVVRYAVLIVSFLNVYIIIVYSDVASPLKKSGAHGGEGLVVTPLIDHIAAMGVGCGRSPLPRYAWELRLCNS